MNTKSQVMMDYLMIPMWFQWEHSQHARLGAKVTAKRALALGVGTTFSGSVGSPFRTGVQMKSWDPGRAFRLHVQPFLMTSKPS